jgi:enhancing lycopene biosynthesis protein 2
MTTNAKRVAVVMCGSGHRDGSEIREAVGVLWALSALGATVQCFAPDREQREVDDHLTGEPISGARRNQLQEAARIARGRIEPLSKLDPAAFDALVLPGGNGAAKNLSDYALKGAEGRVTADLQSVLDGFARANKPIGAVCIVPALVALAFKGEGLELTLGAAGGAARDIEKLGHRHVECRANECHVDRRHRIASTPAYMLPDAPLHEIFEGIRACVAATLEMA